MDVGGMHGERGLGDPDLTCRLSRLHDEYVERVNRAVAEGRESLIPGLVDAFTDEALAAIAGAPGRP